MRGSLLLALAVPGLLSCSGPGAAAPPRPVTHTVTMEAVAFTPPVITAKAGDSIVWINKDPFPHTATAPKVFDSGSIVADGSWRFTATRAGVHPYICTLHPNMKGTLQVE